VARIIDLEKNKPDKTIQQYSWIHREIRSLKQDSSIIICPADKGNTTVILDRETYDAKILELLQQDNYESLNEDPNINHEKKVRATPFGLKKMNRFDKDE